MGGNMSEEQFTIPHMVLMREDITNVQDNINLSDENMEEIARLMGKLLCQDWDIYLNAIKENNPHLFEVEEDEV